MMLAFGATREGSVVRVSAPQQDSEGIQNPGVVVLAINADNDGRSKIREYVKEGLSRKCFCGGRCRFSAVSYQEDLTTVYFVDRKGVLVSRSPGYQEFADLEKYLKSTLLR